MWSHYADSHKGFVLEYDFKNLNCQCDICDKKVLVMIEFFIIFIL